MGIIRRLSLMSVFRRQRGPIEALLCNKAILANIASATKIIVEFLVRTQKSPLNELGDPRINPTTWKWWSSQAGLWLGARVGPHAPGPLSIQFRSKSRWQPR